MACANPRCLDGVVVANGGLIYACETCDRLTEREARQRVEAGLKALSKLETIQNLSLRVDHEAAWTYFDEFYDTVQAILKRP